MLISNVIRMSSEGYTNLFAQGGCEATTGWTAVLGTNTVDSVNEYEGTNCLKLTINAGQATMFIYRDILSLLSTSKYYLISAYLKNFNGATGIQIAADCSGDKGLVTSGYNATTDYVRKGIILQPSDIDAATGVAIRVYCTGAEAQYGYLDALMTNEISAADYAAGVATCLTKYPYKAP